MKTLVNTPALNKKGGVASYLNTLKSYFPEYVHYFTIGDRGPRESHLLTPFRMQKDYWGFFHKITKESYDILHINPSLGGRALIRDAGFVMIAKALRAKVIVFMHGWNLECEKRIQDKYLRLFREAFFRADAFIVLAQTFRSKLRNWGYTGPVYVETTAIDDRMFEQSKNRTGPYSSGNEAFNILFLSRVEKEKGIFEALAAYECVKNRCPVARLVVAGDGGALDAAKTYAHDRKLRDVSFLGHVMGRTKYQVFRQAHCYLFPTYSEGMPTSVLEAMAFGLPVITRPVGGLRDFFENGHMGYMIDSLEPSIFAEALEKLITDPKKCEKIGHFNREYARKRFAASRVARRIKQIYREVDEAKAAKSIRLFGGDNPACRTEPLRQGRRLFTHKLMASRHCAID